MRITLFILSIFCASLRTMAQTPAAPEATSAPLTTAPAPVIESQREVMDTADAAAPVRTGETAALDSAMAAAAASEDSAAQAMPPQPEPLAIRNAFLSRLDLSGTFQLKALYENFTSESDAAKRLGLQLRRFKLDLDGGFDAHSGFRGEFLVDGNNRDFGVENAYLYYKLNEFVGFKGGKLKRPFSQEALQSSKSLYTIERGELYHNFLANTTGYAYFDLGLVAYGGYNEDGASLTYELGVFNGKQNDDPTKDYGGQQNESRDKGFKAKDVVLRLAASPMKALKLEAAVATKAAEDTRNPDDFRYAVNTAYEIGADLSLFKRLRVLGEASWGDNHNKQDSRIVDGSVQFFTFYVTGVWREEYTRSRASELVLKLESLDPDFEPGKGEGTPNDGKLRYTIGMNYFFTRSISIMANYGILQPITKVVGEDDLTNDLDLLWRMSF